MKSNNEMLEEVVLSRLLEIGKWNLKHNSDTHGELCKIFERINERIVNKPNLDY
jgi:hypothetical protein